MKSKKVSKEFEHLIGESNAWIDDDGNFMPVPYMGHEEFASDYLQEKLNIDFFELQDLIHSHGVKRTYEYMCKVKGWIRLINWTGRTQGTHVVGYTTSQKPTQTQRDTLYLWCSLNNFDFDELFKENEWW